MKIHQNLNKLKIGKWVNQDNFFTIIPLTRNQSFSENAIKLAYSNVEFQNVSGGPVYSPL